MQNGQNKPRVDTRSLDPVQAFLSWLADRIAERIEEEDRQGGPPDTHSASSDPAEGPDDE